MAFRLTKVSAIILHTGRGAVRRLEGEGLGRRVRREEALDELRAAVELCAARHEHGDEPLVEGAPLREALDEPHEARRLLLLGQPHDAREEVALLRRSIPRPHLEVAPQRREQHADVRVLLERAEQRRVRLGQRQREPRLVDAPELLAREEAARPAAREDAEVEVDHRLRRGARSHRRVDVMCLRHRSPTSPPIAHRRCAPMGCACQSTQSTRSGFGWPPS